MFGPGDRVRLVKNDEVGFHSGVINAPVGALATVRRVQRGPFWVLVQWDDAPEPSGWFRGNRFELAES
jgi:hypothetical protein